MKVVIMLKLKQKKIMMKAGLERGSFFTIDICSEIENNSTCKLHQENQSYFDGGYINDFTIKEKNYRKI